MNPSHAAGDRHSIIAAYPGTSPIGAWLHSVLRRLRSVRARPPSPRDRVREAAQVRALAIGIRRTDPRYADDLLAAADRHERIDT